MKINTSSIEIGIFVERVELILSFKVTYIPLEPSVMKLTFKVTSLTCSKQTLISVTFIISRRKENAYGK